MRNGNRLLEVKSLFEDNTDINHSLSVANIINLLSANGHKTCRNTVLGDIHTLQDYGIEIEAFSDGFRLVRRTFSITDLKIISAAIAAFKFLTVEKSEELIKKLKTLCSRYEAQDLQCEFHIANRVKTDNMEVMDNIDAITKAMKENKRFTFDYYDYNTNKEMAYNGTRECSPWEMAICNEEYYVVTQYEKYPETPTNFRIDRMKNIHIIDKNRIKPSEDIDIGKYLKSSFSMFSGIEEYVTLRFPMRTKMCNVVYDKFGLDTVIFKDSEDFFTIHVPIKTEEPKAFFSWLALFEGEVQIIKPLSLAEEFSKRISSLIVKIYNTIEEIEEKNHRISSDDNSVDTR